MAYTVVSRASDAGAYASTGADALASLAEQQRKDQEEQQARDEEMQRRLAEQRAKNQQQSSSPGLGVASHFMNSGASAPGLGGAASGATSGTGAAGSSVAHTGSAMGASGGSGAGGGSAYGPASFWPAAGGAAVIGHEKYQNNTGNRKSEAFPLEWGLEGRALYKDKDVWAKKADKVLPGWGDDINIAGSLSSPADMFRSSTWSGLFKSLKSGGLLGGLVKKVL
ncbi:hypothetical protein DBT53_002530, partial [Aerococcus mictus]|uniref:hypothetical protein n=1 Tax=Aerococcus mictus TaxID=2976810 RepID=UPI002FD72CD6